MRINRNALVWFVALLTFVTACKENEVVPANESLVSSESILTRSSGELKTFLGAAGIKLPLTSLQYDVELYKITYKTSYINDQELTASGYVILPKVGGNYPVFNTEQLRPTLKPLPCYR
jgi:hypothetical protein